MKVHEIISEKQERLNEFALDNNTGYSDDVVKKVLEARADSSQWTQAMSLEEALKHVGID